MITKINKSNSGSYKDLFYKVSQELMKYDASSFTEVDFGSPNAIIPCKAITLTADTYKADTFYIKNAEDKFERDTFGVFKEDVSYFEADVITSLNEYFHYIDRIKEIKGGMYTRLPIDENLFLIDADKRSITIPPAFASNGVAVQGDEVSETLYFKIDRYYDATDLAMQNVFIEWKNAAGEEGVSFPWIFDIESEPNYIIFGWPLSSKITNTAGTVQFTVRFYTRDEQDETAERLIYSFSTLTHSVSIKPGLNFNLVELLLKDNGAIDDATELISQRFTSSPLAGTDETASKPTFLDLTILGFVGPRQIPEKEPSIYMNLGGKDYTEAIDLVTQAITEDAGLLSYSWKRKELIDNKTGNSIPFDSKPVFEMRKTEDTEPVDGKTYYYKDIDSSYHQFNPTIWNKDDEEYIDIYERFSVVKVNSTGAYWVVAKNRVGSASEETQSATVIIPNPVTPIIPEGQDLPVKDTLEVAADSSITLTSNAKTAVTNYNPNGDGVLSYIWKRSEKEDGEFTPIEGEIEKELEIFGFYDEENEMVEADEDKRPIGDGYYKVETTTSLNKESKSIESGICRITHKASTPIVECKSAQKVSLAEARENGLIVDYAFPEICSENHDLRKDLGDKVTYQWYRYYAGNSNLETDLVKAANGIYGPNGDDLLGDNKVKNPNDDPATDADDFIDGDDTTYISRGSQGPEFRPDVQGYYFCEVTNHYNGTTATRCSDFFNVTDY